MPTLDHVVLHVRDALASAHFYAQTLGLGLDGRIGPFEVLRVNDALTLALLEGPPRERAILAFALGRTEFEAIEERLRTLGVRGSAVPGRSIGARGSGDVLYLRDLDEHRIEIRTYDGVAASGK
jgi:catechol 2,3-dioxygenase-like lactoylglutathione lyase family enzyme